ncbi:MAG: Gldg family protein [Planctomycetes bacterium]|nr:Gldg family protein [Planctomycetota bacterium]
MNKNIVLAVAKRDLRSWFSSPANYVFVVLFAAASCAFLVLSPAFFLNNLANLDTLNAAFPVVAGVFVSLATMGMWSSERSHGTQELLFTLPATDFELQLGKFLAYVSIYTASLAFTLVLPLVLTWLGNPDVGQLFANYVGFWLLGVMLVAVTTIGSQLTNSATIACLISLLLCAVVLGLSYLLEFFGAAQAMVFSPIGQFREFAAGKLPVSGLLLFGGMTVTFFQLGLALLSRRHWRGAEGVHGTVRFAGLGVASLALTVIGVHVLPRFDATVEGIHTLTRESRKLIEGLPADKTVFLTAYVSEEVPEMFVQQKKLLLNLVDQFDSMAGGRIEKSLVFPEPFSPEARAAESNYGIRAQTVPVELPGGGYGKQQVFLGFVVQCGTEEVVTPFVEPALPLEYELMRSIRTVASASRRKVGILKTDVEFMGGIDFQTFRQKPRWQIADELQQQYQIESVDADRDYPEGLSCLVVPQPSSLVQEQMDRLQAWMLAGNPTLLLEDPAPFDPAAQGTAADEPKGGAQAQMMGGGGPQKGNFAGLFGAIGLQPYPGELVFDLSYNQFPGGQLLPEFVFVRDQGFAADSPITSGLQNIVLMMGGHLTASAKPDVTFTPLLRSPRIPGAVEFNGVTRKSSMFQQTMFGSRMNPNPRREWRDKDLTIAARVQGKPAGEQGKGLDVICVADLDIVGNQFFQIRRQMEDPNLRFDNVTFVLNCIDTLAGDESLIALRNHRPILRKLGRVEEAQREFEVRWNREKETAAADAEKALAEARARLDEAVRKITDDASLDEQAKEVKKVEVSQVEQRKLDNETSRIEESKERRLEEATHDRDAARSAIHRDYKLISLVLSVLPGLLVGLLMLLRRASRAAAIVPQNRRIGGAK